MEPNKTTTAKSQTMGITNDVAMLTDKEKAHLALTKYYSFVYETGLIYLNNGYWDCKDSQGAREYLDKLGVREQR